jgi:hypothetical protein
MAPQHRAMLCFLVWLAVSIDRRQRRGVAPMLGKRVLRGAVKRDVATR